MYTQALLDYLSQQNVFEQSCRQIRREICRFVSTGNGQRCREPSCTFETHNLQNSADNNTKPQGAHQGQWRLDLNSPASSDEAHAANSLHSPAVGVGDAAASTPQVDQQMLDRTKIRDSGSNYLSLVVSVVYTTNTQPNNERVDANYVYRIRSWA